MCYRVTYGVVFLQHYDIWGNSVNVASRMESTGRPNSIQITEETMILLKKFGYSFEARGKVYVKGKGDLETHYVVGEAPSSEGDGMVRSASLNSQSQQYRNSGGFWKIILIFLLVKSFLFWKSIACPVVFVVQESGMISRALVFCVSFSRWVLWLTSQSLCTSIYFRFSSQRLLDTRGCANVSN